MVRFWLSVVSATVPITATPRESARGPPPKQEESVAEPTTTQRPARKTAVPAIDQLLELFEAADANPESEEAARVNTLLERILTERAATAPADERPRNVVEALVAVMRDVSHV